MRVNETWEIIISILMATLGGMARLLNLNTTDHRTLKLSFMLSELFIAAFIGSMIFMLAKELHSESEYLMWLLAGTSGWVGPKVLNLLTPVLGKLNIDIKEQTDEEKNN